jgi:ABC-type spermidine/putrescine transport system permease subunit I
LYGYRCASSQDYPNQEEIQDTLGIHFPPNSVALVASAFIDISLIFALLLLSFMRKGQTSLVDGGIFFGNYLAPFQDPSLIFVRVFYRTITFSLINTFLTLLVAYPTAFFVAKILKGSSKVFLLILIALPFYISELVRVYAWMNILRETGTLNYLLVNVLGVMQTPVEFLYSNQALFIVFVFFFHVGDDLSNLQQP